MIRRVVDSGCGALNFKDKIKMGKTYIGIDPGAKGFVAVMYGDGRREYCSIADGD